MRISRRKRMLQAPSTQPLCWRVLQVLNIASEESAAPAAFFHVARSPLRSNSMSALALGPPVQDWNVRRAIRAEANENMTIRKVEVERFSVTSSKLFEAVVAALEAAVGHPDMVEFGKATKEALAFAELESAVYRAPHR